MTIALLALTLPPATKVLAVAVSVYGLLQYVLKNVPVVGKYIVGWKSVALNCVLAVLGIIVVKPADMLYTQQTLQDISAVVTAVLAAAGIHGTVQNQAPKLLAQGSPAPKEEKPQ